MNTEKINSLAWDREEENGNWWTRIVERVEIENAKKGNIALRITTSKSVPLSWTARMKGKDVLVLCGGGGQQTPLLAAYGSNVTSLDISAKQIEQDRKALDMYGLSAKTVVASALSLPFSPSSFDAVVNPISLNFIDDIEKVYAEVDRVLRPGGSFLMGIANPVLYIFDEKKQKRKLKVKYTLPFSTTKSLSKKECEKRIRKGDTIEFSHTLASILSPLFRRGFIAEDFFSDSSLSEPTDSFIQDAFLAFLFRKSR